MSEKLFKTVKDALQNCKRLPEEVKEILKTTVSLFIVICYLDSYGYWIS